MYQRLLNARDARRNEDGFTLIELLIVIVVLGVLAGIVVFGVGTFRADSQLAACKADLKTVSVATDAYNARNGTWPTAIDGAGTTTLVGAKYLKSAPATSSAISLDTATGAVTSTVTNCVN
jgi:prepilin-type N-terminal cleavage/methylation domain-containing protein